MPTVVGIDEAGYGPLLGPLVVGATIWHVAPEHLGTNWWKALKGAVCRNPTKGEYRLAVNDSKKLFDQKKGIPSLERSVLAFLRAAGVGCETVRELLSVLTHRMQAGSGEFAGGECGWLGVSAEMAHPWYRDLGRPVPFDAARAASQAMEEKLTSTFQKAGIWCRGLAAEVVPEAAFNDRMRQTRNKASVNVEQVLKLVEHAVRTATDPEIHFQIDRLGGRTDYREILQTLFPARPLEILEMSAECSRYRLSPPVRVGTGAAVRGRSADWTFSFSIAADDHYMPVALAGMLCKYVRELLMHEFNAWWAALDPGLRPTAGYYTDARRFLDDISPLMARSGLRREDFVRVS